MSLTRDVFIEPEVPVSKPSIPIAETYTGALLNNKYYSGMCVRIYFGEYWVDEISEIEFTLQEQVAPIFGYASYTWDKVARGNRYVTGSFVINYKEVGYLQTILNSLSSNMTKENTWFNYERFNLVNNKGVANKNLPVADLVTNFDELAESYEDALWGVEVADSKLLKSRLTDTFFYGDHHNKNNTKLKEHGFNILITYGSEDLSTGCGGCVPTGANNEGNMYSTTAQTIVNVQLTSCSQRIDPSGNPVQEVYTFIARDLQGNVRVAY